MINLEKVMNNPFWKESLIIQQNMFLLQKVENNPLYGSERGE